MHYRHTVIVRHVPYVHCFRRCLLIYTKPIYIFIYPIFIYFNIIDSSLFILQYTNYAGVFYSVLISPLQYKVVYFI